MRSTKCLKCGLVNFADASSCKRCGAKLEPTVTVLAAISPEHQLPNRTGSTLIYLQALGAGLALLAGSFVYSLIHWPKGDAESSFLVLGAINASFGVWFSTRRRLKEWLVALCLSSFYLLALSYGLYSLFRYNQEYGGWFWTNKFYFSPVVLYVSLPLSAFLGARFGSKRSCLRFAQLMSLFIVTLIATAYARGGPRSPRQMSYSCDLTAPDELVMRVDVKVGLEMMDEPMHFRAFPSGGGGGDGGWKVTILRKNSAFMPDTQMTMRIDGKELQNTMWPVNSPDGSSLIDFGHKQDYSQIVNWRVGLNFDLFNALINASHIELTWGNLNLVLPNEKVDSLRNFVRSWAQVLKEEDVLCTNSMCVQGAMNPKR